MNHPTMERTLRVLFQPIHVWTDGNLLLELRACLRCKQIGDPPLMTRATK